MIEGKPEYVYYAINSQITSIDDSRKNGRYDTQILRAVLDPSGNPRVIGQPGDKPTTLNQIVATDRSQVEKWLKENKSQKVVPLGAGK